MRAQLWTWFVGMIVLTFPWHYVGILGMPRRMASYDYTDPGDRARRRCRFRSRCSAGCMLVISASLFFAVLIRGHRAPQAEPGEYRFSVAVHEPVRVPVALNGFALWLTLMIGLTVVNYGYPIAQLLALQGHCRSRGLCRSGAMSAERLFTSEILVRRQRRRHVAVVLLSLIAGFVLLPYARPEFAS